MTHSEIVRGYSDQALAGIIKHLSSKGWKGVWEARLRAAQIEQQRRRATNRR